MVIPAHIGLSWCVANCVSGDRRFRICVFLAGVLPDLDGIAMFFSDELYRRTHHILAHGLAFALLWAGVAFAVCRGGRLKAAAFALLATHLHYAGDYFLTRIPLTYWWPLSDTFYGFPHAIWLGHPANAVLGVIGALSLAAVALWRKRTPIEMFSPQADARIIAAFTHVFARTPATSN